MPALSVRPSVAGDMPALDALFARSYPRLLKADYPPSLLVTAIPLISRAQPGLVSSGTFYVLEEAGKIRGAGGWTAASPQGGKAGGVGHIRHFATDPDHIRRGIARAIMERCVADAQVAGINAMMCFSTRTGVGFYTAMGFDVREERDIALRSGIAFPVVVMTRRI